MRRNIEFEKAGLKSGVLLASPAYPEQILAYIKDLKNGKQFKKAGRKIANAGEINERIVDFMMGLRLIEFDSSNNICLTQIGDKIGDVINKGKNVDFSNESGGGVSRDLINKTYAKITECSDELYPMVRDVFLNSYSYRIFCDYLDGKKYDTYEDKAKIFNDYWNEMYPLYGDIKTQKEDSKKSDKSSGGTTGGNQCPAFIFWCVLCGCMNITNDKSFTCLCGRSVFDIISRQMSSGSKQIVFTGAPGTGKTYSVRKYISEYAKENNEFIQFHSSYDYTDFVEGLRAGIINQKNVFVRMDGVFKKFCRKVVEKNIEVIENECKALNLSRFAKKVEKLEEIYNVLTNLNDKSNSKFVELNNCIEKMKSSNNYFVIDEINRADLSKVFGELMFGLEEGYRGVLNRFDTQYHNLPTYVPLKVNQKNTVKLFQAK